MPLTSARSFRDKRLRVVASPTGERSLRSLGAAPQTEYDAHQALDALAEAKLDGVESDTHAIVGNGYVSAARYLSANLPLVAKAETLVIRKDVLSRLSDADEVAVRAAAQETAKRADPAALERDELGRLCAAGVKLVSASPADLAGLRREGQRAYADLERDAATRSAIESIQNLGVPRDVTLGPCPDASAQQAKSQGRFPEGRFESRITKKEYVDSGSTPPYAIPFRITMRNGRWHTNEDPTYSGPYLVDGDKLTFLYDAPPEVVGQRDVMTWSYYRGKLTFKDISVVDPTAEVIYAAHPWRKIG
jgi:hypothetical protein